MMDVDQLTFESAQTAFLDLLSKVDPSVSLDFVKWVCRECEDILPNFNGGNCLDMSSDEEDENDDMLEKIIKDLRQKAPLEGMLLSEKIYFPNSGQNVDLNPSTTLHVDAFLYDEEEIDKLCDEGKITRSYCLDCGSHNTKLLDFISHSASLGELDLIFKDALPRFLPNLQDILLVDVGSRLGAVLYGAYCYSPIEKIFGVEINREFCEIQQHIIDKFSMGNRVKVKCADICNEGPLLKNADIVILNNVFEFFLPVDVQVRTWEFLRSHVTKRGCILVTIPRLEEATVLDETMQPVVDLDTWVEPIKWTKDISKSQKQHSDGLEWGKISFYRVK